MNKLRNSKIVKAMCLLLASSLMYVSCSTETVPTQSGCTGIAFTTFDTNQVVEHFEKMLDYAKTIDHQEDYTSFGEFHQTLYGNTEEAQAYVDAFEAEGDQYASLGFDAYVSSNNHISQELKTYLINYAGTLSSFLQTEKPTLSDFTQFVDDQSNQVSQSALCNEDQKLMMLYLATSQGFANWYYKHYYQESFSTQGVDNIQLRGCNFFEALGCGLLALVTGAVVGIIAGVVVLAANVFYTDGNGNRTQVTGEDQENLAALAGFALGIYVGTSIYDWCCGNDEIPEQDCLAPTGATYIQTDCNEFVYRVFGPSNYGDTQWGTINECQQKNTNPTNALTPIPRLTISIPNFGEPSTICAQVTCISDASNLEIFYWESGEITFESDVDFFPLNWMSAPPAVYTYQTNSNIPQGDLAFDNIIFVNLNTPATDIMTYNWSVNPPHTIINGGGSQDNHASIKINSSNVNLFTNITAVNNCLNQTDQISSTTIIQ